MIIRIVKMTFQTEKIDEFIGIFSEINNRISSFEGCTYLELVRDKDNKNIFFTISNWKDEIYLENYRESELFKRTWNKTKILFSDKPVAWSTNSIYKS